MSTDSLVNTFLMSSDVLKRNITIVSSAGSTAASSHFDKTADFDDVDSNFPTQLFCEDLDCVLLPETNKERFFYADPNCIYENVYIPWNETHNLYVKNTFINAPVDTITYPIDDKPFVIQRRSVPRTMSYDSSLNRQTTVYYVETPKPKPSENSTIKKQTLCGCLKTTCSINRSLLDDTLVREDPILTNDEVIETKPSDNPFTAEASQLYKNTYFPEIFFSQTEDQIPEDNNESQIETQETKNVSNNSGTTEHSNKSSNSNDKQQLDTSQQDKKISDSKITNLQNENPLETDTLNKSKTTVMLRNIPNKYTHEMLLAVIDQKFKTTYDFFYLPIDFQNKCNVGYAFINFLTHSDAVSFMQHFDGFKLSGFQSNKICELSWGRVQGLQANIELYKKSAVMCLPNKNYQPMLFKNGVRVAFPICPIKYKRHFQ